MAVVTLLPASIARIIERVRMNRRQDQGPWRVFWHNIPDRQLSSDEFLVLVRRWQRPSTWKVAFGHVQQFLELQQLLAELDETHELLDTDESKQSADECFQRATAWYNSAIRSTKEYTWMLDALRRHAPKLIGLFPVVEFFDDPSPRDSIALAEKLMFLEGEYLEYQKLKNSKPDFPETKINPVFPDDETQEYLTWEQQYGHMYKKKVEKRRAFSRKKHPLWTDDQIEDSCEALRKRLAVWEKSKSG